MTLNEQALLKLVFGLTALCTGVFVLVLNYHWARYGVSAIATKVVQLFYLLVTGLLFLITTIAFFNALGI